MYKLIHLQFANYRIDIVPAPLQVPRALARDADRDLREAEALHGHTRQVLELNC